MEDILNIRPVFEIRAAEQPEGELTLRITDEKTALLKIIGDKIVREADGKTEVLFYSGDSKTTDRWRRLGGAIAKWMKSFNPASAALYCGPADKKELLAGLILGGYKFSKYKKQKDEKPGVLTLDIDAESFEKVNTICSAANMAREWAHEPACVINPHTLSDRAETFAAAYGLKCTILDDKQLREMGAGAIVAVGQGSKTPSRMIILEYAGTKPGKPVVLVGKSLTYDSGGYCVKPPASLKEMKYDKCGAMAVLGILRAAAELKLSTPVVGIICAAENMISAESYRVDDIIKTLSGKTVEITDTDAEGRLVLADGLTYAQQHFDPRCIINYCTLTGACVTAFGHIRAGVLCNNDELFDALYASGEKTRERLWRIPGDEDFTDILSSTEADMCNSAGRDAALCTAGAFLNAFVDEKVPWAHLDIAGTAYDCKAGYLDSGATGFGVRLTVNYLCGLE